MCVCVCLFWGCYAAVLKACMIMLVWWMSWMALTYTFITLEGGKKKKTRVTSLVSIFMCGRSFKREERNVNPVRFHQVEAEKRGQTILVFMSRW